MGNGYVRFKGLPVRLSQFILNFGPGSLIETERGTRIVLPELTKEAREALASKKGGYDSLRIGDPFLESLLKKVYGRQLPLERGEEGKSKNIRVFLIPSNRDLGLSERERLIETREYPPWKECHNVRDHGSSGQPHAVIFRGNKCPLCGNSQARTFRFIRICDRGHMQEIDWFWEVHDGRECPSKQTTDSKYLLMINPGGPLKEVKLRCPYCGKEKSLGDIYYRSVPCRGHLPEEGINEKCESKAAVVQKQASVVTIPEVFSYFTLILYDNRIRKILFDAIKSAEELKIDVEELIKMSGELRQNEKKEALDAYNTIKSINTFSDMIREELNRLIRASEEGIPPVKIDESSRVLLRIDRDSVFNFSFKTDIWKEIIVVPIEKLSVTMIRVGYRRRSPAGYLRTPSFFKESGDLWIPATRFTGEGVFLMPVSPDGEKATFVLPEKENITRWMNIWSNRKEHYRERETLFKDPERSYEVHPGFVLLHSLAHLLIREVSVYAGYSHASLRERIYVDADLWERDGRNRWKVRGGILIYTALHGGDGSLGGITSLFSRHNEELLDEIFGNVRRRAHICSNDPICSGHTIRPGEFNGAACHACVLISETSCEHRNMWLDRNVLREVIPL